MEKRGKWQGQEGALPSPLLNKKIFFVNTITNVYPFI